MKRFSLVLTLSLIVTITGLVPGFADGQPVVRSLVRISLTRGVTPSSLFNMGMLFACGSRFKTHHVDVVLQPEDIDFMRSRNMQFEIIEKNVDDQLKPYKDRGSLGVYRSVPQVVELLHSYNTAYPDITKLESIGTSWEGRDVWALKISDNAIEDEEEPACLVMGAHHAREWISYEVPLALIERLLTGYGSDEALTTLVNEREIWIVPMVNPDGVNHSHVEYTMWRKNRRPAPEHSALRWGSSKIGVDPNRNYSYQWGGAGTSSYPGSDTYKGPEAFSEPETSAIKDLTLRENFTTSTSFHSYSELVLYPFGYAYDVPNPHEPVFKELAEAMAQFNGYEAMNSADLYPAAGDSEDWLYGEAGVFSMLIELAKRFVPSDSLVPGICEDNVNAALYQIEQAGNLVEERTRHISEVQSYIESLMKKASFEGRELNDLEKKKYLRMIRVRNVFRTRLVEEVCADTSLGKAKEFSAVLYELPVNLRMAFIPAVNEVLSALRESGIQDEFSREELIRELLEIPNGSIRE